MRILLNHFKWNKSKLMERYYDEDEQEKMFREAKVVHPNVIATTAAAAGKPAGKKSSDKFDCEICCLTFPRSVSVGN